MTPAEILDRQRAAHETHTEWRSQHAAWRDEVASWSAQCRRTLDELDRIAWLIRELDVSFQAHGASLQAHEWALQAHERELADLQRKALGEQYDPATPEHEAWTEAHAREQLTHDALKRKHREVFARLRKLEAAALEGPS